MRYAVLNILYVFSLVLAGVFSLKLSSGVFQLQYLGFLVVFVMLLLQVVVFIKSLSVQSKKIPNIVIVSAFVFLTFLCLNYGYSIYYAKTIIPFSVQLVAILSGFNLFLFAVSMGEKAKLKALLNLLRAMCIFASILSVWSLIVFYYYKTSIFSMYSSPLNEIMGLKYFNVGLGSPNSFVLGHKNFGAGFVLLSFPLSLALAMIEKSRWRIFAIFSLLTQLVYSISCQSRGAFLAFIVGIIIVGVFIVLQNGFGKKVYLLGGSLLVVVVSLSLGISSVRNRLISTFDFQNMGAGDLGRLNLLKTGWAMFLDSPILGSGVGTVSSKFPLFWTGESHLANSYQLHCMPLQLLVEYGALGSLIIVAVLMYPVFKAGKEIIGFNNKSNRDRIVILACALVAILGYLIYSFTDYQLDVMPIAVFLSLAFGIVAVLVSGEIKSKFLPEGARALSYVLVLCLLLPVWFSGKTLYGKYLVMKAEMALVEGDNSSLALLDQAIAVSPTQLSYLNRKGHLFFQSFQTSQNPMQKESYRNIAIECFEQSNDQMHGQWLNYYSLSWLNYGYDNARGLAFLEKAALLNSKRSHIGFIGALYSMQMERPELIVEFLALEIVANPGMLFTKEVGESDLFPTIVDRALEIYQELDRVITTPLYLKETALSEQVLRWYAGRDLDSDKIEEWDSPSYRQLFKLLNEGASEELLYLSGSKVLVPEIALALIYSQHSSDIVRSVFSESGYDEAQASLVSEWLKESEQFDVSRLKQEHFSSVPKSPFVKRFPGYSIYHYDLDTTGPRDVFVLNKSLLHELLFRRTYSRGEYISQTMFSEKYKLLIDELMKPEEAF